MEKLLNKAFLALIAAVSVFAFTACDDDNDKVVGGINYGDDYVSISGRSEVIDQTHFEFGSYDTTTQQGWFVVPVLNFDANNTPVKKVYKFTFTSPQQLHYGTELHKLNLKLIAPDGTEIPYASGTAVVVDADAEPDERDIEVRFRNLTMGSYIFNGKVEIDYKFF